MLLVTEAMAFLDSDACRIRSNQRGLETGAFTCYPPSLLCIEWRPFGGPVPDVPFLEHFPY